jgi:PAS domain S-box-containing protein
MFWSIKEPMEFSTRSIADELHTITPDKALQSFNQVEDALRQVKDFQQKIEDARRLWVATFDSVDDGLAIIDRESKIVKYNKAFRNEVEKSAEEIIGHSICDVFCIEKGLCKFDGAACITRCELERFNRNGKVFRVYVNPIIDEYLGQLYGCVFIARDITTRVKDDEEIKRLSLFPKLNPNPVLEIDLSGNVTYHNEATMLALKRVNMVDPIVFLPEDIKEILEIAKRDGKFQCYREIYINNSIFAAYIDCPESLKLCHVYIVDITTQMHASEIAKATATKYYGIFEAVHDTIFVIDVETLSILDTNTSIERMYGYKKEEIKNTCILRLSAEPAETQKSLSNGVLNVPLRWHKRKDGTLFPVEINASEVMLEGRHVNIAVIRDLTERMNYREELDLLYKKTLTEVLSVSN